MSRLKVDGYWTPDSKCKINPFTFYYYSLADIKHYTESEYGKKLLSKTGNNFSEYAMDAVRKRLKMLQYVKDTENNTYYYTDNGYIKIDFENQEELKNIFDYQKQVEKQIMFEAIQDNIPKRK